MDTKQIVIDEVNLFRGYAVSFKNTLEYFQKLHSLNPQQTYVFGKCLMLAVLFELVFMKKKQDRMNITIQSENGNKIIIYTDRSGTLKGYMVQSGESVNKALSFKDILGNKGYIEITKDLGYKEPIKSHIDYSTDVIEQMFAQYLYYSDQITSLIVTDIQFNDDFTVKNAGGFIILPLPEISDNFLTYLEFRKEDSIDIFDGAKEPSDYIKQWITTNTCDILLSDSVEAKCDCSNEKSRNPKDPSPLKVKEVWVGNRRYIVCHNEDQAKKDQLDRDAILASLEETLKNGGKSLVGNKGYKKYLKTVGKGFEIDGKLVKEDAKFDGKWVLRTNTDLPATEVAGKYKQLWMVEKLFRSLKSILETRPIFHKCDETIRGHVFCSFLAMVLTKELQDRLKKKGDVLEWDDVIHDLDNIEEIQLEQNDKHYAIRVGAGGCSGKVFQAAGVAMPPEVKNLEK